jgi:WD40 repeat protein
MRTNLAVLSILCCLPIAVSAQSARQENTINLPAGVSVEVYTGSATVSRAGNLVAAICSDHIVRVWSVRSGELQRGLDNSNEPPSALQFSGNGRLLAVAYEIVTNENEKGAIKVFDIDSWKVLHVFADLAPMYSLAFSPDGRRLAGAGPFGVYAWDLPAQKKLATISPPFGGSNSLSFSADGKRIATADGDAFVRVYDTSTGSLHSTPRGFLLEPMAVVFSPDSKSVLAGGVDKSISIIDPETGKVLRSLPKQPGLVMLLDVSADGKQTAVVYTSPENFFAVNHLRLWDLDKGAMLADFQKAGLVIQGGAFVGDHYLFVASSANQLTLWSVR